MQSPRDYLRCCICGTIESPPDGENYVEVTIRFPAFEGPMRQFFGAHATCLQSATAPGFNVESPFTTKLPSE